MREAASTDPAAAASSSSDRMKGYADAALVHRELLRLGTAANALGDHHLALSFFECAHR